MTINHIDTIDDAMTALTVARNTERRIHALRALKQAAQAELDRLLPIAPDWSCPHCRMTWAGGTTPANMLCPECGEQLQRDAR